MKRVLGPIIWSLFFASVCWPVSAAMPVVSQLHVVSVHVRDHAAFDAVFLLFRDTLKLPLVYGELSKPGHSEKRLYAGFSAGNAYLEPCGPYPTDAPFPPTQPARFVGLTFRPAASIAEAASKLTDRDISHSEVFGSGQSPRFVYLNDGLLTGPQQAVGIWEIQNKEDPVNLEFLKASLLKARGGALGVLRLEEIRMQIPDKTNLVQWSKFLDSTESQGDVVSIGNGPVLRFVSGQEMRIEAIVLKVQSVAKARQALSQSSIECKKTANGFELDAKKTLGLRIIFKEN
jgi:hypothetical protein